MSEHYKGQGVGWIHFAGIFFIVAAIFNGIAAVSVLTKGELFDDSKLVVSDLKTWGWIFIVVAVVQLVAGIVVLTRAARRARTGHHHRRDRHGGVVRGLVDPAVLGTRDDDPLRPDHLRPRGVPRVLRVI